MENHFQELDPSWNTLLALTQKENSMEKLHNYFFSLWVIFCALPEALTKNKYAANCNMGH